LGVWGKGLGFQGLGCRVQGLGLMVAGFRVWDLPGTDQAIAVARRVLHLFFFFFFTLVAGPRRSLGLKLSDTN